MKLGASYLGHGKCEFVVWGPWVERMDLQLLSPRPRSVPMQNDDSGYWRVVAGNVSLETAYCYRLEGERLRPDPASRHLPEGAHRCSRPDNACSLHELPRKNQLLTFVERSQGKGAPCHGGPTVGLT
jgi:1,4-alpha-glucan branching enzyme